MLFVYLDGTNSIGIGDGQQLSISCSCGFAFWPSQVGSESITQQSNDQALNFADSMAYLGKIEGRNRAIGFFPLVADPAVQKSVCADPSSARQWQNKAVELETILGPAFPEGTLRATGAAAR